MSKTLKSTITNLGLVSTTYAVPKLIRSKRFYQKILWISFILGSSLASCLAIYESVLNYLNYDVVTVTKTFYEQPTEFPTVTICSYKNNSYFSNKLNEIIIECFFAYNFNCNSTPNNYFESFFSENLGQCLRFNSGKNITNHSIPVVYSTIGGVDDSFSIRINKTQDMAVWIHNRSSPPNLELKTNHYNNRVFSSAGFYTEVIIQKISETKLAEPYNDCLNDVTKFKRNRTIINYLSRSHFKYTQEKCLELCFDIDYIETNPCNCKTSLGKVWTTCWINLEKQSINSCTWNFKVNFYSTSILQKCSKYCPLECTSVSYDIRSHVMADYNVTRLKIYFGSLKHTSITQEPKMKMIDLISNIGGTLGLLIGFSFVTFFEIFEIFIEALLNSAGVFSDCGKTKTFTLKTSSLEN